MRRSTRWSPPVGRCLLVALRSMVTHGVLANAPTPYRRFIAAGQMTIEGTGYKRIPWKGVRDGTGVEAAFTDTAALASAGRLSKALERTLPPGKYLVWVQAQVPKESRTNGTPITIEVALGGAKNIVSLRSLGQSLAASAVIETSERFQSISDR